MHWVGKLGHLAPFVKAHIKTWVLSFSKLSLHHQICSVVESSYYKLRISAELKPSLSHQDLEKVIRAFMTSHLDYCNSLYHGLLQSLLNHLYLVQNAAARLLMGLKRLPTSHPCWLLYNGSEFILELSLRWYCLFLKLLIDKSCLMLWILSTFTHHLSLLGL